MTDLRRALTVLGLHAAAVGTLGAALLFGAAAEPTSPPAAPAKPEPAKVRLEDIPEIVFYVAKGDADACGHGCDQWIAADGKIDGGAPQHLRASLAKIGKRRLPIFFHSPGGMVGGESTSYASFGGIQSWYFAPGFMSCRASVQPGIT